MGRLPLGGDLLGELTEICRREGVRLGRIEAIGAVRRARISFYDQSAHEYRPLLLDRPQEIASLSGNVSLRDGEPVVHAHVTLADRDGSLRGGHLEAGTEVFAAEFILHPYAGPDLTRGRDEVTGLPLWTNDS